MKHTHGPWHRNIPPATKYVTVWSGRNKHVAYVATKGLSDDEVEANIRLIAAAPDLLAALKNLENDDGSIPPGAWKLVKESVFLACGETK